MMHGFRRLLVMVHSWRYITESMVHSSDEKVVDTPTHTHSKKKEKSCTKQSKRESWKERRDGIPRGCVAEEEKQRCGSVERRRDATCAQRKRRKGRRDERREVHQLLFFRLLLTGREWDQSLIGGSHGLRPLPPYPPSSPLSGRVNGAKERDGAALLLLVLLGPPRWEMGWAGGARVCGVTNAPPPKPTTQIHSSFLSLLTLPRTLSSL